MNIDKNECTVNYLIKKNRILEEKSTQMLSKNFKISQILFILTNIFVFIAFLLIVLFDVEKTFFFKCIVIYSISILLIIFGSIFVVPYIIKHKCKNHLTYD